jgi:hypothetical protein
MLNILAAARKASSDFTLYLNFVVEMIFRPVRPPFPLAARFSLDFLVRFEPFQGLARTPWPGNILGSSLPVKKH